MTAGVRATVLVPTHEHGPLLRHSVESALRQTVREVEVLIVGDGADAATTAEAERLAGSDDRVRFFPFPKGPRLGEVHRTAVLREARGDFIAYLADDDLWLPGHVASVLETLAECDFVHARGLVVLPDQSLQILPGDFAAPGVRERLYQRWNFISLSCAAHTRALYERLPGGWETTPADVWTDLHMWRRLLVLPDCRAASTVFPTALTFPSPYRRDHTLAEREAELRRWAERLADPAFARELERRAFAVACRSIALYDLTLGVRDAEIDRLRGEADVARRALEQAVEVVHAMEATATWRLRDRLLALRRRWVARRPRA
jgi:glycosyltransferase involved in cell wall biosynthesis